MLMVRPNKMNDAERKRVIVHCHRIRRNSLVAQILIFALFQFSTIRLVKAEPKNCESAGISFTTFEPKEISWWSGTIQSSALLVNGKQLATLRLAYNNKVKYVDDHVPEKYILVLGERIGVKALNSFRGGASLFTFKDGSPSGFAIPVRYNGETAVTILYATGKDYSNLTVDFTYNHPMRFDDMMLHIVCFLKSDFIFPL